jgi:hypothetical protein
VIGRILRPPRQLTGGNIKPNALPVYSLLLLVRIPLDFLPYQKTDRRGSVMRIPSLTGVLSRYDVNCKKKTTRHFHASHPQLYVL